MPNIFIYIAHSTIGEKQSTTTIVVFGSNGKNSRLVLCFIVHNNYCSSGSSSWACTHELREHTKQEVNASREIKLNYAHYMTTDTRLRACERAHNAGIVRSPASNITCTLHYHSVAQTSGASHVNATLSSDFNVLLVCVRTIMLDKLTQLCLSDQQPNECMQTVRTRYVVHYW